MTESALRGIDFMGLDINPLAVLVCEAKAAIDLGADVDTAAEKVVMAVRSDLNETIDVDFPNRSKWFADDTAIYICRIRRAICNLPDLAARKVMWTVFAETIRMSSNSRTSTYKLHVRPEGDEVNGTTVAHNFATSLRHTLMRVREYRASLAIARRGHTPTILLACGDARKVYVGGKTEGHQILITSPPYGDNQTTIPYGQFSYLALCLIPREDLPFGFSGELIANTHALDSASLGGSLLLADQKIDDLRAVSSHFDRFAAEAASVSKTSATRKMAAFLSDFLDALTHIRSGHSGVAHWAVTTGNRTAGGIPVPFDRICRDFVTSLGGIPIAVLQRRLPNKRMPTRNSLGTMITVESTLVAEFS